MSGWDFPSAGSGFRRRELDSPRPRVQSAAGGEGDPMALGKEIGQFSLKSTSVRYSEEGGSVEINYEGTASGYGTVVGTLSLRGEPGAKAGPCSWTGQGFLESGEVVSGR